MQYVVVNCMSGKYGGKKLHKLFLKCLNFSHMIHTFITEGQMDQVPLLKQLATLRLYLTKPFLNKII